MVDGGGEGGVQRRRRGDRPRSILKSRGEEEVKGQGQGQEASQGGPGGPGGPGGAGGPGGSGGPGGPARGSIAVSKGKGIQWRRVGSCPSHSGTSSRVKVAPWTINTQPYTLC